MAIVRWNPWNFERMFDEDWELPTIPGISRLVGQGLNLFETDDALVAEAALPGVPEENIDVTVEDGIVRVVGAAKQTKEDKGKKRTFMSTLNSSYNYAFRLPPGIVADQEPVCELADGVLIMRFPKVQKAPPKKLKITKKTNGKKPS